MATVVGIGQGDVGAWAQGSGCLHMRRENDVARVKHGFAER